MKVIFLDNDGVICLSTEWGSRFKRGKLFDRLNPKAVKILNEITDATGAEIVISSDWRHHASLDGLREYYQEQGIKKLPIGVTDYVSTTAMDLEGGRMAEIRLYLQNHPEIDTWVAIDDLSMFDLGEDHFVHCPKVNEGIKQSGIKEKIIKLLNENI